MRHCISKLNFLWLLVLLYFNHQKSTHLAAYYLAWKEKESLIKYVILTRYRHSFLLQARYLYFRMLKHPYSLLQQINIHHFPSKWVKSTIFIIHQQHLICCHPYVYTSARHKIKVRNNITWPENQSYYWIPISSFSLVYFAENHSYWFIENIDVNADFVVVGSRYLEISYALV